MSDSLELENLFGPTNIVDEPMYERVEYTQLYDIQSGSYASGQISFNTDARMKNHIVSFDSYLQLPIQVSMSTDSRVAVKASILSFIQGIQIESSQGTRICNDQISTPIVNNIKLLIDSSVDFLDGNELHFFGKDRSLEMDVSGAKFFAT
jgi:hypothetical protein